MRREIQNLQIFQTDPESFSQQYTLALPFPCSHGKKIWKFLQDGLLLKLAGMVVSHQICSLLQPFKTRGGDRCGGTPSVSDLHSRVYRRRLLLHIMLRDLLTQKSVEQKPVTDFRYPRACRFRKYQIENRLWELTYVS
jgi:hypothetical protein